MQKFRATQEARSIPAIRSCTRNSAVLAFSAVTLGASAQNISLYGTVDAGVVNTRNSSVGNGSHWGMGSGVALPSRWGLRGQEDLGGGNTASFLLESGIDLDTGELKPFTGNPSAATPTAPNGPVSTGFNRRAHVGLAGGWGQLLIGRDYSPLYYAGLSTDVMHFSYFGNLQSIVQAAGGVERLARLSNGLFYTSPTFAGFKGRAAYSFGSESAGTRGSLPKRANQFFGLGAEYTNDGLSLHATWQELQYPEVAGSPLAFTGKVVSRRDALLAAIYTTGAIQVSAGHWEMNSAQKADNNSAGISYGFGVNRIYAQIQRMTLNLTSNTERSATIFGIAISHNLSRRTQLYASYGLTRNSSNSAFALLASDLIIAPGGIGQKPSALALGIKHDF